MYIWNSFYRWCVETLNWNISYQNSSTINNTLVLYSIDIYILLSIVNHRTIWSMNETYYTVSIVIRNRQENIILGNYWQWLVTIYVPWVQVTVTTRQLGTKTEYTGISVSSQNQTGHSTRSIFLWWNGEDDGKHKSLFLWSSLTIIHSWIAIVSS